MDQAADRVTGRSYSNIDIGGSARVHLGDVHAENVHYSGTQSSQSKCSLGHRALIRLTRFAESAEERLEEYRSILFVTDPADDRSAVIHAKGERVPGTCEWIRSDTAYQSWLSDGEPFLWIVGGPGRGKTMLSMFLLSELEVLCDSNDRMQNIYYFCSAEDERRSSCVNMLRSLLYQLLTLFPYLLDLFEKKFKTSEILRTSLSSREALWSCLEDCLASSTIGTVFCVLDGLDECDEDSINWLSAKMIRRSTSQASSENAATGTLRLVLVSRYIEALHRCTKVSLDPAYDEEVSRDIGAVVSARVAELSWMEDFNEDFQRTTTRELVERSEGTFLWVGLVMTDLSAKASCAAVLEAIDTLPKGLPAVYDRMLSNIRDDSKELCNLILLWVAVAMRPLSFADITYAIKNRIDKDSDAERTTRRHVRLCGPILEEMNGTLRLIHHSAREYLLQLPQDHDLVRRPHHIDPEHGHVTVASRCLDCLSENLLTMFYSQSRWDAIRGIQVRTLRWLFDLVESQPLLEYAINHIADHLQALPKNHREIWQHASGFFDSRSELRSNWVHALLDLPHWRRGGDRVQKHISLDPADKPIIHACWIGSLPWVTILLQKHKREFRVLAKKSLYRRALEKAVSRGFNSVAEILLENCAGMDIDRHLKPLEYAVACGHLECVKLLVRSGADLKNPSVGCAAFDSALRNQQHGILQWIFDQGADISKSSRPLRRSLESGNTTAVRLLLMHGADPDPEKDGNNLCEAAKVGVVENIELLIDFGVRVNAVHEVGLSPLFLALLYENREAARCLVQRGADVQLARKEIQAWKHGSSTNRDQAEKMQATLLWAIETQ